MKNKIIIGVDPGTKKIGVGIIHIDNNSIINFVMTYSILLKEETINLKFKKIFNKISFLIKKYNTNELSIETPFLGKNVQSMLKLVQVQGVVIAAGLKYNIPFNEYSPKKIKNSITGNGNSSKEEVSKMLINMLNIKKKFKNLDESDGLAVAVCHFLNKKKLNLKKKNKK
ncbi:crossover junction endodeoxyribonuclease RuvC [Candidatus Shikimatogenerans silvanidophilus]|uniref:crossover junction endodeoxyribonuclease RuvC n=1 Tax=Candidatus Shikimatogenerans silvanidophilus TaxID=2782547 RepID=UPI001BAA3672|nr:crossover junction endodeoxyribonuclease RuvC [Candidatus Shikimatogenerans silvanidophilus]